MNHKNKLIFSIIFSITSLFSCNSNDITPPSNFKISKITQKNSNFKDYGERPQSVYEYDKSGLLTQQIITYLGSTQKTIVKSLYNNSQLTKIQFGEADLKGNVSSYQTVSEISYDSKNRIIKNISDSGKRIETFEYSGAELKPNKVTIKDNGKLFDILVLKWLNDNLIETKSYGSNNILYEIISYKYDTSPNFNQSISKQFYIHGTGAIAFYLSKNNLIEENISLSNNPFRKLKVKHQFFYNTQGLPIKFLQEDSQDNSIWGFEIDYSK